MQLDPVRASVSTLEEIDSRTLHAELKRLMGVSSESLASAARIFVVLQSRGEDLSYMSSGNRRILQLVGYRVLSAEAGLAFGASKQAVEIVRGLSHEDQSRLASGKPIRILTIGSGGEEEVAEILGSDLSLTELRRVVEGGRILSVSEQRRRHEELRSAEEEAERRITATVGADVFSRLMKIADACGCSVTEIASRALWMAAHSPRLFPELVTELKKRPAQMDVP